MALSKILPASQEQYAGARNLIINGACAISQRGTQTNQTSAYSACDRWQFIEGGSTVVTTSQSTDTPSSQGFANSLKVDVTTASGTPSASDYAIVRQKLEGQDLQHLLYGTSSAKKITLSFWVKSAKTGKHYVELFHTDAGYHNQQSYTISAADTWQYVSLTYNGYETTAFDNDNNNSLMIQYWLMAGSDYTSGTTTENTWHNTNANRFSGLVNAVDDTANNWYITGVQLEVGETATPFEHRSYADELARCKRYYQKLDAGIGGAAVSSTQVSLFYYSPVQLRALPSVSATAALKVDLPSVHNRTQTSAAVSFDFSSIDGGIHLKCTNFNTVTDTAMYVLRGDGGSIELDMEL